MGKETLGAFIRKIDYLRAKADNEYRDRDESPLKQLETFDKQCDSLTFDELKDAYSAFEQKLCVRDFPERTTPPSKLAEKTADILVKRTKALLADHTEAIGQVLFHIVLALIKAGPGSTHCVIIEKLNTKTFRPSLQEYTSTLNRKELIAILAVTKNVTFKYTPNEYCTDTKLGLLQRENLVNFFLLFTPEQFIDIQEEFLDLYRHYHLQLPAIADYKEYSMKISFLLGEMRSKFEKKNPFMKLQNADILRQHLTVLKDLVCCEQYAKSDAIVNVSRRLLLQIIMSKDIKEILKDLFNDILDILFEISKNTEAIRHSDGILYTMQDVILRKFSDTKVKISIRNVDNVLQTIINFLLSGRSRPVDVSENLLNVLKKSKAIDWKNHIKEARHMIKIIGEMPKDKMQNDNDSSLSSTQRQIKGFLEELLQQLKKSKVMSQLKDTLVQFFFDCILTDAEIKAELGRDSISKETLDLEKEADLRVTILRKVDEIVQDEEHPWENMYFYRAVKGILSLVVRSYSDGRSVTDSENKILMSIFKHVSEGEDSVTDQFYDEDNHNSGNWKLDIFLIGINDYMQLHMSTRTFDCIAPIMPNVLKWARIAYEENHKMMMHHTFSSICILGMSPPEQFKHILPEVMDLILATKKTMELFSFISMMYPQNPKPVHDRIDDIFNIFDDCKEDAQRHFAYILNTVAQSHPEVFTKSQIGKMFDRYKKGYEHEKYLVLMSLKAISEKYPKRLVEFFPQLCDDKMYKNDQTSVTMRCGIISCIGATDEKLGQRAADHLMKYVDFSDQTIAQVAVRELGAMAKLHQQYMQKYKPKLEKVEATCTVPQLRDAVHDVILILEGKSVENIAEDVQQQQEEIAVIDEKVDVTINTVVGIGEKVIEHDKEIGELEEGLERVKERVDDVEEDLGETKVKVEEIDNKTMSNAPKWSRDLTKLMNPTAENDWRLLASRLGYSNDDIRGWATQHDPCMALLSEWYATHKTSEASYGVLSALTEMNRMDGAVIVENAMKAAEDVVEDEEFEYASPPPVFLSYQWGFQNEVKLLKQHLNMAGYECWMDVGQMGGGDKLFAKIDNGIRGAKVVICCVTDKYSQSPNCNREVNLSVNLNKPIIPLLMEKMDWPPKGSMGPIFSEYLFIRFFQRGGEETTQNDQRYWPIPKFQELLMQLNFYVVPDQKLVKKMYARWWDPIAEDITIDKNKKKTQAPTQQTKQNSSQAVKKEDSPLVFLSYQWGKQPQCKVLYKRLTSMGYSVWMDIHQMGGGDSLYDKIDKGMRGCKAVISCVTQKYSLSANCRREISLADALKKPIIPLLLEQIKWPPDGPMSMVFTELLYINFYRDESIQLLWKGDQFDELIGKLGQFVPEVNATAEPKLQTKSGTVGKAHNVRGKENKQVTDKNSQQSDDRNKDMQRGKTISKTAESGIIDIKNSSTNKQGTRHRAVAVKSDQKENAIIDEAPRDVARGDNSSYRPMLYKTQMMANTNTAGTSTMEPQPAASTNRETENENLIETSNLPGSTEKKTPDISNSTNENNTVANSSKKTAQRSRSSETSFTAKDTVGLVPDKTSSGETTRVQQPLSPNKGSSETKIAKESERNKNNGVPIQPVQNKTKSKSCAIL